ncbi:NAD-dependent deacetylase [Massilia psychrophila]|uniref:protein acetyllysine N-acetyltransferase n=3 Tax=Massilia psychrophila TaxID=1603353 RepID=A0A2G8T2I6_9BURK|nr:NAD-dependent deacetylase [Massilia psychrophila]GGE76038.1 NAD-dependent protein deacetylase [Massilia psychrophila]
MQYMHMRPTGPDEQGQVDQLTRFLAPLRRVLVLTGAGISTASGIPDYRGPDGIRRGKAPIQGPEFRKFEAVRKRYWARSMVGYPALARAAPNPAHQAIAELQADARLGGLITQNVDGLHQRAGSHDVIELHGNIHGVVCLDCHAGFSRRFVQDLLEELNPGIPASGADIGAAPDGDAHFEPDALARFHVPDCVHCGGTLKPNVVFFGDGVAPACTTQALAAMEAADALLVVGSSLMVFSGFRFCRMAAAMNKPIAAINLGITRADDLFSLKIDGSAERLLPALRAGQRRAW